MDKSSLRAVLAAVVTAAAAALLSQPVVADPTGSDTVSRYDTDKDHTLDLAEVKTAAAAHFDQLNKDGDSTLETKELQGVIGPQAFKAADADHDGSLSKDEYLALVEKLFKRADANHDGTLDAAELKSKSGRALKRLID